jgi:hypothetical protein
MLIVTATTTIKKSGKCSTTAHKTIKEICANLAKRWP